MVTKITTILMISPYILTGDEIGMIKAKNFINQHAINLLPEFCIREENGRVMPTDYYLQFIERGDTKYYLFDIVGMDTILEEDISSAGIDEILDFDFRPLFQNELNCMTYEDFGRILPRTEYIAIEVNYIGDSEDVEVIYELIGKVYNVITDKNKKLIKNKKN